MKKKLLFVIKLVISVALVVWLIEQVDWEIVGNQLINISPQFLVLYVVCQLLGNLISAKKWQIIASYKGLAFSLRESFFVYVSGTFINNFLPSTIGGDAYRGLWLAKRSGAKAAALSTVVFDRFIGLWTIALLALLFGARMFPEFRESTTFVTMLSAIVIFFVVDIAITYAYCQPWFNELITRLPFHKLKRFFEEIISYTRKDIWLRTSLWSALFALVGIGLANFFLFQAIDSEIRFLPYLSLAFLVVIVSSIPVSINNIGIKEWAYITFFGLIGVSLETAVTVALLSRFIQMLISFTALPYYLSHRGGDEFLAEQKNNSPEPL